jgi:LmbE family N-acetylglucosaminyl deacetylase
MLKKTIVQSIRDLANFLRRFGQTYVERDYVPQKALLIAAHPDDPEFFCAGTIALWAQRGAEVRYVLCTSGQIGTKNPTMTHEEVGRIRESEQLAAARVTGVKDVVFLRYSDGILENSIELRRRLVREIRLFCPEVVVISDPTIFFGDGFVNHPDHRAAATAALEAVYPSAGMPLLFPELEEEGLQPHQVHKLYIFTWQSPNTWVDIGDTVDIKIEAVKKHASQIGDWDPSSNILSAAGQSARFTGLRYAETFRVINLMNANYG